MKLLDIKNNLYQRKMILFPVFSFLLSAFTFSILMFITNFWGSEGQCFFRGDMYHQYIPFYQDFISVLKGNNSYWYSFSNYLGSGSALTYSYYTLNPFVLLYYFEGIDIELLTMLIVTCKLGLAAASFSFFLNKCVDDCGWFNIIISLFYGMSTFSVSNYYNLMWLDILYILPILIYLIISFIKTGRYVLLILAYAYMFITNFYMAYIAGVFSAIFFVLYLLFSKKFSFKNNIKYFLKKGFEFAFCVIVAVLLCGLVLFSTVGFLMNHIAVDNFEFQPLQATILDLYNSMFIGAMQAADNQLPLLYCGLPSMITVLLFWNSKKIEKKYKILFGIILSFLLVSMKYMPLYQFMHAFDHPDFYAYRFAFCFVFIVCYMLAIFITKIDKADFKVIRAIAIGLIVFYSFMIAYQKICYANYHINSQNVFLINVIYILLWLLGLWLLLYKRSTLKHSIIIGSFILLVSFSELLINGKICLDNNELNTSTDDQFEQFYYAEKGAVDEIKSKDDSFYRIYVNNELNINAGKFYDYNSLTTFSSADNYSLRMALSKLGMSSSNRNITIHAMIPGLSTVLGVKYGISLPDYDDYKDMEISADNFCHASYVTNENSLPLAYMVSDKLLEYSSTNNSFKNINNLLSAMTNSEKNIYSMIDIKEDNIELLNMIYDKADDTYIFSPRMASTTGGAVTFKTQSDSQVYIDFHQDSPVCLNDSPSIYTKEYGSRTYMQVTMGGIYKMDKEDNIYTASIASTGAENLNFAVNNISMATADDKIIHDSYEELNTNPLVITSNTGDVISGKVMATEDKNLLFISLPYDVEWNAFVDGQPVEVLKVIDDAFMAIELEPGEHDIVFMYHETFSTIGAVASLVGLFIICILILINIFRKEKQEDYIKKGK